MSEERGYRPSRILAAVNHYLVIFLFVAFVISCCLMLFVTTLTRTLGIVVTEDMIATAAKKTFWNVVLLSAIATAVDGIRRKFVFSRPIRRIADAADRMTQGDFSVRIPYVRGIYGADSFNQVISCFNTMAEELSGVETLRTDFIANVSHEMKTPLAVMQNYGALLSQPGLEEEKRVEYARGVMDASRRLASLITNTLKLNKLENQQIFPTAEPYNLSEQLCECLLQYEDIWERAEIDIKTDIEEDVTIQADGELLSLVWNNLLSNAFKFTPAGGQVTLSLAADETHTFVRVSDTGCGMSPEVGAHIFEKFYQGDTSHATAGNGLGLALVKRIMDITGGEISVTSEPGKGSTFTVRLRRAV